MLVFNPLHDTDYKFKVGSIYIMRYDYARKTNCGELIIKAGTPVVITNIEENKITIETADKIEFDITSCYLFNTGAINGFPPKAFYKQVEFENKMSLCYKICSILVFLMLIGIMIAVNVFNISLEFFNSYLVEILLLMLLTVCCYIFSKKGKIPDYARMFLSRKENHYELEILLNRIYSISHEA